MKAVRLYAVGDLRVEEVEIPKINENQVLVKVMTVGVCGSDIPRVNYYGAHVSPITIGHEFSGEIVKLGSKVESYSIGEKITVAPLIPCNECEWCLKGEYSLCNKYDYYGSRRDGAMAQYVAVEQTSLLKIPDRVSYEDAATIDPCANAMHALIRGEFKAGDTVCVYGSGPIGLYAIQCAKVLGAKKVIAVDVLDEKLEIASKMGADYVINSKNLDPIKAVKEFTNGNGADLVIDMSGVAFVEQQCILSANKMGRIVFLGISHKGLDLSGNVVDDILRKQLSIKGSWNSFSKPFPGNEWFKSIKLFSTGELSSKLLISHKLDLDDAPAIFKKIKQGNFYYNKIMFYPWGK